MKTRNGGMFKWCVQLFVLVSVITQICACAKSPDVPQPSDPADGELLSGMDIVRVSSSGDYLTAACKDTKLLYAWKWSDLSGKPATWPIECYGRTPVECYAAMVRGDTAVTALDPAEHKRALVLSARDTSGGEIHKWTVPMVSDDYYRCRILRNTANGESALVMYRGYEFQRVGILTASKDDIDWIVSFTGPPVSNLPEASHHVNGVAMSRDRKLLAMVGSFNGGWIQLTQVETGESVWGKAVQESDILYGKWTVNFNDVCFSIDDKVVYVGGNTGVFGFDSATGKVVSQWDFPSGRCISMAASPDGRLIAGGSDLTGDVYVWESSTGKVVKHIKTGQYTVYGLCFSPDAKMLVTSGCMKTGIKIWNLPSPL